MKCRRYAAEIGFIQRHLFKKQTKKSGETAFEEFV